MKKQRQIVAKNAQAVAPTLMERVFVLKNVRLFYKKGDRMRFISHLDMTRFMSRLIRRAGLPVWYTEGFNPHAYFNFALPLSLGFESEYEVMDFRFEDDDFSIEAAEKIGCGSRQYELIEVN